MTFEELTEVMVALDNQRVRLTQLKAADTGKDNSAYWQKRIDAIDSARTKVAKVKPIKTED